MLPLTLRPYRATDRAAVLALIDADRLPGQPLVTPEMLAHALAGRSAVDAEWWAALDPPAVEVATTPDGHVVGVISWALRPGDDTGLILWLHCREDEAVARALIDRALSALAPRAVEAFQFSTALTLGLEALPVARRRATRTALERAGFTGERLWRALRAELPRPGLPVLDGVETGPDPQREAAWRLLVRRDGRAVAEAVVGHPVQGVGVLWWIEVGPGERGRGLGRALLGSALDLLTGLGAAEVVLYVDDDEPPGGDRDRTAANALYDSAGFTEVDDLWSYTRPGRLPGPAGAAG
ncbi:GNAT family N-acetyltransferase [Streptomyces sp. NPDC046215]|uniref:N-acetyltransferase domain-containing protein n=1 Tax=Streptomyces stramineus TaxID=173861 RepID=A0ABN1B5R6_9ACTN